VPSVCQNEAKLNYSISPLCASHRDITSLAIFKVATHLYFGREVPVLLQMSSKHLQSGLSSDIYDAAVAGMKKATRLNHNAAATRKPTSVPNFNGLASLGPLFQSELKLIDYDGNLPLPRSSKHGPSPCNKHRGIGEEDQKQANTEIVWPSV
jgi:hypothetical protein